MERERLLITLSDILQTKHIDLDLKTDNQEEAVLHVANLLKGDDRVLDWNGFYGGLAARCPTIEAGATVEICIPHARTNCVSSMVMSVGRSSKGIQIEGHEGRLFYFFAIGVPVALAADYLRIVGALARIFKDSASEKMLRNVETSEGFLEILSEKELGG